MNTEQTSENIFTFKIFVRPHLDYGEITYEQVYNSSFHQKIESVQYNAIRSTSKEKLSSEIGVESHQLSHWYRKFCYSYKFY